MGRIRQMDDHLATLIAAGEVVTGPASVVRELIDNALDAGATGIDVTIDEGGLRSIRVADDGSGMDEEDAVLCLSRHATSKLSSADELSAIRTMGFRGEALAAILAVSQLRIETQRPEDAVGTRVRAAGGGVPEVAPAARRPGTTIEVGGLFFNTPARREFLDTPRAEASRVLTAVQRVAIARPDVRFTLRHGDREILNLPATDEQLERIRQVYDLEFADSLLPILGQRGDVVVSGFVAAPAAAVRRARRNTFVVNGRPFESFEIRRLITTTFASLLPQGSHVEAVVCIDLPPGDVDVNVSPDKSQVRFRRAGQVFAAVSDALRYALGHQEATASLAGPEPAGRAPESNVPDSPDSRGAGPDVSARIAALRRFEEEEKRGDPQAWEIMFGAERREVRAPAPDAADDHSLLPAAGGERPAEPGPRHGIPRSPESILQVSNTFLICSVEGGMLVVDQHSAHERINYERLRERFERHGRNPDVQPLMFPEALKLDAARMALLEEMQPFLERLGFELSPAGPREMLVQAVPAALGDRSVTRALQGLMDAYSESRSLGVRSEEVAERITPLEDRLLMTMACHAAIKAGQPLSEAEIRALWSDLVRIDLAAHDVHGRPGAVHIPAGEIARRLGRTI
jgi:DNA mismatch repair protein MutL